MTCVQSYNSNTARFAKAEPRVAVAALLVTRSTKLRPPLAVQIDLLPAAILYPVDSLDGLLGQRELGEGSPDDSVPVVPLDLLSVATVINLLRPPPKRFLTEVNGLHLFTTLISSHIGFILHG